MSAGVAMDTAFVIAEEKTTGFWANAERLINDDHKAGALFDLVGGFVFDGLSGLNAGQAASDITSNIRLKNLKSGNLLVV